MLINSLLLAPKTSILSYIFTFCCRHCEEHIFRPHPWDSYVKQSEKETAVGKRSFSDPSIIFELYCGARTWSCAHDSGFAVQKSWTKTAGVPIRILKFFCSVIFFVLFCINRLVFLECVIKVKDSLLIAGKHTLILIWDILFSKTGREGCLLTEQTSSAMSSLSFHPSSFSYRWKIL